MLNRAADIIAAHIEPITQEWVASLRQTPETEIHNTLLTRQIVDGLKATLAALAESIRRGQAPDPATAVTVHALETAQQAPVLAPPASHPPVGRPVLPDPLAQMLRHAQHQGQVRQQQGYAIHEMLHEYISLRRITLQTLGAHLQEADHTTLDMVLYVDRMLDELALNALTSYHASVITDLEWQATRDLLTGLYNAEYFRMRLQEEVRRAHRQQESLSLLMLDVDLLKHINDTYGHLSGDLLLQTVAAALRSTMRDTDLICRYGGDEFTIILPATDHVQAEYLVTRIEATLAVPLTLQLELFPDPAAPHTDGATPPAPPTPITVHPSVSIGLATYPTEARSPETLLACADTAMYRVKQTRRSRR